MESGLDHRSVGEGLVAHEVVDRVVLIASLCDLNGTLGCQLSAHLQEVRVWDGTDGIGRLHHDILLHTDVDVAVGAHHITRATG